MKRAGEMNGNGQPDLGPKVRFSEFEGDGAWHTETIGEISEPIKEKVGEHKITPVSITAGVGFVPQADKFGRDISGEQYKNYTYLRRGNFAYNKGNSKSFPEGYVCQLHEFDEVAASSAFICFKLKDGYEAKFLKGLFDRNTHGRQLAAHITSGARSNGLLNLNAGQFYSVQLPFPPNFEEQERIAECLASIDVLIEAETEKLDALKDHKQGLMQQLFPSEGESLPSLRFPEFSKDSEWSQSKLGAVGEIVTGSTPSTTLPENYGNKWQFVSPGDITDARFVDDTARKLSDLGKSSARTIEANSILFVCIGSTIGKVAQNRAPCATNQQINAVIPNGEFSSAFLYFLLKRKAALIAEEAGQQAVPIISKSKFSDILIRFPSLTEQERIAEVLSSIEAMVSAQFQKVQDLKEHKLGLLQQLFPILDEVEE